MFEHKGAATLSDCEKYRYTLFRGIGKIDLLDPTIRHPPPPGTQCSRPLIWIMLNPSTADATKNDPTIRKVIGFTERSGYNGAWVVNLFAFRATKPDVLRKALVLPDLGHKNHEWCEGPENRAAIESVIVLCGERPTVVCAWGAQPWARRQAKTVLGWLAPFKLSMRCLGLSKDGDPLHPLMLSYLSHPLRSFINPG